MPEIYEPHYSEWGHVLQSNLRSRARLEEALGRSRVVAIREGLIASALTYTTSIAEAATRCGVTVKPFSHCRTASAHPIVMTGHQPVMYHPGLLCKMQALKRFASETGTLGVQVVIDIDEGDGGAFTWPRVSQGQLELRRASIAAAHDNATVYREQRVADADIVGEIFQECVADLRSAEFIEEAQQAAYVGSLYQQLTGEPIAIAHAVVRWALADVCVLEIPLSVLVRETEARSVVQDLIRDGSHLAEVYNETLQNYRREHRIHNPANPFPNMECSADRIEVPLWRIHSGKRAPLFVETREGMPSTGASNAAAEIVPRGSITTLLLRGFCSDIFIHGLGGVKYDRFVEQFVRAYWGVALPQCVVTSKTEYMFPEKVKELNRSLELASLVKEMTARTESFFGQGIFSHEEELSLESLAHERVKLRQVLQEAQAPEVKSATVHALNAANRAVRNLIEGGSMKEHITNAAAHEVALARWSFREFPFFLYKLPRSA